MYVSAMFKQGYMIHTACIFFAAKKNTDPEKPFQISLDVGFFLNSTISRHSTVFCRDLGDPGGSTLNRQQADYESAALLAALRSCNSLVLLALEGFGFNRIAADSSHKNHGCYG